MMSNPQNPPSITEQLINALNRMVTKAGVVAFNAQDATDNLVAIVQTIITVIRDKDMKIRDLEMQVENLSAKVKELTDKSTPPK